VVVPLCRSLLPAIALAEQVAGRTTPFVRRTLTLTSALTAIALKLARCWPLVRQATASTTRLFGHCIHATARGRASATTRSLPFATLEVGVSPHAPG
jgi:hypothetical protein